MGQPVSECGSFYTLQRILVERNMKAEQLRTEMLEKAAKTRQDLEELRGSLETLKKVKKLPRITVLHQMASQERINTSGWDAYVRKHIIPYERVTLPPDEEVDIDLLTNKLLSKGAKLLPPTTEICRQNFFPCCKSSFMFGMTRPRALVCGAQLPNTLIVTLLWSSRTLGEVEAERNSRRHRLYRHLRGERELYDSEYSSSASLQSRLPDQRRRGGIGDVSEEELAMAEAVWTLQWEMTQPLRHRQRAVPTKRKSRRQVQREKKSESAKSRAQSIPRRSRASSQRGERPGSAARSASTEAPSTSRQDVSVSSNRTRGSSVASSKSQRRRTRAASEARQKPKTYMRTLIEVEDSQDNQRVSLSIDNRPVFKNVVSLPSDHIFPSMFIGDYGDGKTFFQKETKVKPWLLDIIPMEQRNVNMSAWQLNDVILSNLPRNDTRLIKQGIQEVAKIVNEFSCRDPSDMRRRMLNLLTESWMDVGVLETVLQTLSQSLNTPPEDIIPHLLAVYPLCPEPCREVINDYLSSVGLIDPDHVLRCELITWAKTGGKATSKAALRRKATHFLAQWQESWECNARLVAEELRQERLQAQIRANMVRALARYEPNVVNLDGEDIVLELADHPSEHFEKSPSTIDVLNYFVEMNEPALPETGPPKPKPRKPPTSKWYRRWRRHNKDLVCPERANMALRGLPPACVGLQQPTALVTHAAEGLAPLPWPVGTLNVTLRVAGKFYYHGFCRKDEDDD